MDVDVIIAAVAVGVAVTVVAAVVFLSWLLLLFTRRCWVTVETSTNFSFRSYYIF